MTARIFEVVYWKNSSKKRKWDGTLSVPLEPSGARVRAFLKNEDGKVIETESIKCDDVTEGAMLVLTEHRVELMELQAMAASASGDVAAAAPPSAAAPLSAAAPPSAAAAPSSARTCRAPRIDTAPAMGHHTNQYAPMRPTGEPPAPMAAGYGSCPIERETVRADENVSQQRRPPVQGLLKRRSISAPPTRTAAELLALLQQTPSSTSTPAGAVTPTASALATPAPAASALMAPARGPSGGGMGGRPSELPAQPRRPSGFTAPRQATAPSLSNDGSRAVPTRNVAGWTGHPNRASCEPSALRFDVSSQSLLTEEASHRPMGLEYTSLEQYQVAVRGARES